MRFKKGLIILFVLFFAVCAYGILKGAVNIPARELFLKENQAILNMRILRVLSAILVGSGLAVSGIVLQAITRNPLAEPYLLGTSSGAGLAAVAAVIIGISRIYIPFAAFIGALASVVIVYHIAKQRGRISDKSLILAGVIVGIALSAVIVFLVSIFGNEAMHEMSWWLWGSLQVYDVKLVSIAAVIVITGITAIYIFSQDLNAISLGEEEAMHLGIDARNIKKILIIIIALITAALTSICGIIGFVGLIIPHIMRMIAGPNHKTLIPLTCAAASIFMILCDTFSRVFFAPVEIPIGVITALIGAPVFIFLLKGGSKS